MNEISLDLVPISADALRRLTSDRVAFEKMIDASVPLEWPHEALREALDVIAEGTTAEAPTLYAIVDRSRTGVAAGGVLVGDIGFHGQPDEHGDLEVGYSVLASERRRGIARWALATLLPIARRREGALNITARCEPENVASIRVLEGAGFERVDGPGPEIHWRLAESSRDPQQR